MAYDSGNDHEYCIKSSTWFLPNTQLRILLPVYRYEHVSGSASEADTQNSELSYYRWEVIKIMIAKPRVYTAFQKSEGCCIITEAHSHSNYACFLNSVEQ